MMIPSAIVIFPGFFNAIFFVPIVCHKAKAIYKTYVVSDQRASQILVAPQKNNKNKIHPEIVWKNL